MRRVAITVFGLAAAVFLTAAPKAGADSKMRIDVHEGEDFVVVLPEHGWPDYVWQLEDKSDDVEVVGVDRCQPSAQAAGPCGEERWRFHAADEGKAKLKFRYVRPWDPKHPADRMEYQVKVHD